MEGMISLNPQKKLQLNSTYSGSHSLDPEKFMDANALHLHDLLMILLIKIMLLEILMVRSGN